MPMALQKSSIVQAMRGGGKQHIIMIALAVVIWLAMGLGSRAWLKKREAAEEAEG